MIFLFTDVFSMRSKEEFYKENLPSKWIPLFMVYMMVQVTVCDIPFVAFL